MYCDFIFHSTFQERAAQFRFLLVFDELSASRHSGEGRSPGAFENIGLGGFPVGDSVPVPFWIPACAGVTGKGKF